MLRRFPSSDSTAAKEEDIAALSGKPVTAYLLGHDVGAGSGAREQAVMVGAVARSSSGSVSWVADLPQGCTGAPVFTSARLSGDTFKLVCIGVVLPGDGHHPIATFDRIRTALRTLASDLASALGTAGPTPQTLEPKRHWWQRRG